MRTIKREVRSFELRLNELKCYTVFFLRLAYIKIMFQRNLLNNTLKKKEELLFFEQKGNKRSNIVHTVLRQISSNIFQSWNILHVIHSAQNIDNV